ncbi:hypothetical protein EIP91_001737 [Steccherinum ochraceum]|uniref:Uncharacterized protein n=1 Tax=Steccherinum ochraceum TaxID=92696 RepID=A0A4R0RQN1_9APHY|nr:hypothetical protein EIP91_001737 [Steccherinum ochraceum]
MELLSVTLRLLVGDYRHRDFSMFASVAVQECARDILNRMENFFEMVWSHHDSISCPTADGSGSRLSLSVAPSVLKCVLSLTQIYHIEHGRVPRPTTPATNILLYYWTYCPDPGADCIRIQRYFSPLMGEISQAERATLFHSLFTSREGCMLDFYKQVCKLAHDENIIGDSVQSLLILCTGSLCAFNSQRAVDIDLTGPDGLIYSLVGCCQRQACTPSVSPKLLSDIRSFCMGTLLSLIRCGGDQAVLAFAACAVELNYVGTLCFTVAGIVEAGDSSEFSKWTTLVHFVKGYGIWLLRERGDPVNRISVLKDTLWYRTFERVWYDTLRSLRTIQAQEAPQLELKDKALEFWREYGNFLGLREGTNAVFLETMRLRRVSPRT